MATELTEAIKDKILFVFDEYEFYEMDKVPVSKRAWENYKTARAWVEEQVPVDEVQEPKVSRGEVMAPMPDSPQALQTSKGLKPFTDRGYSND